MVRMPDEVLKAHHEAAEAAKAAMPELDVWKLIKLVCQCAAKKITPKDAALQLCDEYSPLFEAYVKAFTPAVLKNVFSESDDERIRNLGEGEFSEKLCEKANGIFELVNKYIHGEIDKQKFIDTLMHTDITDISKEFLKNFDIDLDKMVNPDGTPVDLSSPVVGYLALSAAYSIMMKALDDASVAYEHRLQVEEECRKSAEMIIAFRQEMEEKVSRYLGERFETVKRGFAAMDAALLKNDTDGFIMGNTELQKMLNYDIQFRNQEEFDDLMDSDLSFKL